MMPHPTATPMPTAEAVCKLYGVNYDQIIWHSHVVPTFPIVRIFADAVEANRLSITAATPICMAFIEDGWDIWNIPT